MAAYTPALKKAVQKYPDDYQWPIENVPVVADRMKNALERGSYNHNSPAFRWACKTLGIKPT